MPNSRQAYLIRPDRATRLLIAARHPHGVFYGSRTLQQLLLARRTDTTVTVPLGTVTDGLGQIIWEINGHHFESLEAGKIRADVPSLQIVVDLVDFVAPGQNPTWLLDEEGKLLGQYTTPYSRFHSLVDWNGDGLQEIVLADVPLICDGHGQPLARLAVSEAPTQFVRVGDLTRDGWADTCIHNQTRLHVFTNPSPSRPATPARAGSGFNATLY